MKFSDIIGKKTLVFDGAMGTMLQRAGLKAGEIPEKMNVCSSDAVKSVHRLYIEAGADVISTNSFGANAVKLAEYGMDAETEVARAVALAKSVAAKYEKTIFGKEVHCVFELLVGAAIVLLVIHMSIGKRAERKFLYAEIGSAL